MSLANLQAAIAGWEAALAADSASPQPSYELDGERVSQAEWRTALLQNITDAKKGVNAYQPYVIRTRYQL